MDLEQLRLRADPLRQLLAQHQHPLKHGQALDLLAAVPGLRNWPEVCAFPERLSTAAFDIGGAHRLARRIAAAGGPSLDDDAILAMLAAKDPVPPLAIWPEGPPAGIYVCADSDFALEAINRYVEEAGGKVFYTEGLAFDSEYAIELGDSGIFSAGLRHAPTGTLVVASLQIAQEEWEAHKDRMTAAWNAANAGMRVVIACQTPDPDNLHRDVALLSHGGRDPEPFGPSWEDAMLRGMVTSDGDLQELRPFMPKPKQVDRISPAADGLALPAAVVQELAKAIEMRSCGWIIAGMEPSEVSDPMQVVLAVLAHVAHLGPVARIHPHHRSSFSRERPEPAGIVALPTCASVESALADGYTVLLVDSPYHGAREAMDKHSQEALFIVPTLAAFADRAFTQVFSLSKGEDQMLARLVAAVCVGTVRGKKSKPFVWDLYAHVPDLQVRNAKRKKPFGNEELIERERTIRWQDQVLELLRTGDVSEKSIRKDFPYFRIPKPTNATRAAGQSEDDAHSVSAGN